MPGTITPLLHHSLLRTSAELFTQPAEAAFVNQVVQWHFSRKQLCSLDSQMESLDIDLAFRAITGNDEKTEPIDAALEIPVRFLGMLHGSI